MIKTTLQNNMDLSSIYVYTLEKFSNAGKGDKNIHSSVVFNSEKL